MKELIKAMSDSKHVRYISIAIKGLDVGNVNSENRAEDFDRTFSSRFYHWLFALDFTVARHSDQCNKLSCGIPTLPASKAFTTIPICEDVESFR